MRVEYIVIHHSLTKDGKTKDWDAIRKYHMGANGWSDIGYHYGVESVDGIIRVIPGRSETTVGAHVGDGGFNSKSLGICVVGNYDLEVPPAKNLEVALNLVQGLMKKYGVPPSKVIGHREAQKMAGVPLDGRKSCPGKLFDMDAFRGKLK